VIVTIPNAAEARRVFDLVKAMNPSARILVRADEEGEVDYFRDQGAQDVLIAEHELAESLSRRVLDAPVLDRS
jgi:CPA2 family monovalent cation:H+ antiporter-2